MGRSKSRTVRADLLEKAHEAIDRGDRERARRLLRKLVATRPPSAELAVLEWRCAALAEDLGPALEVAQAGAASYPDEPELQHAIGWTLLEMERFDGAISHLEEACFLDADFADAWYDLAVAREQTGDLGGMRQAFRQVWEIDSAPGGPPLRFRAEQLEGWAKRAIEQLDDRLRAEVADVPVFVQEYPDEWILEDAPWDPRLLGLFDGPTWADLAAGEGQGLTPHVYLFQRNLERVCGDSRDLAEQVRITVHHELGHFLGLDEDALHERGLG